MGYRNIGKTKKRGKRRKRKRTKRLRRTQEHSVIKKFRKMLEKNPIERMYIAQMIEDIPPGAEYDQYRLSDTEDLLQKLNKVLTKAPEFDDTLLVGTPFSAIILWAMGNPTGIAAFRRKKINKIFKKVLKEWSKFLDSPKSRYVLNRGAKGWLSKKALEKINMSDFQHNKNAKYFGFKSWNDFFSRKLVKGARPIYEPDNDKAIVSGFDCTIYKISYNVKEVSDFWIKDQPYSLRDMLNNDQKYVDMFVGGDIFQAFLNPFNYHRWHSPISGTVIKATVIEGLYFSQRETEDLRDIGKLGVVKWISQTEDPTDQDRSEGYITHVQTRAIFYIRSDDPKIGVVCVMPVGMVEISSCKILPKIKPGYHLEKGEEIGYFQFGGSTSCLIFQKGVIKQFDKTWGFCRMGSLIATAY